MATRLSLFNDPEDGVDLRHVTSRQIKHQGGGVFVRFEGAPLPMGFRSESLGRVWDLKVVFAKAEQEEAYALLNLLSRAFTSADGRLLLEPDGADVAELDAPVTIQVHSWDEARQPGGIIEVTFSATEVR